jgi:putative oxidoreductase
VCADRLAAIIGHDVVALCARVSMAAVFFLSGRSKVDGVLNVSDSAVYLFANEYRVPLIDPWLAAHLAAYAEHLLPLLLVLGLLTRLSAAGLIVMTAVIQTFVYPDAWPTHLSWIGLLLYLLGRGPGRVSVDKLFGLR